MSFTYRGLKNHLERHIVTETEIDRQMQRMLQQNPRLTAVQDRPTQLGDEVVLDYAGFCNGEQFAGGTAQGQTLVLGSGMFIPGFEEQLVDKMPEEVVTVKVTFPEQYHSAELAGKDAEFQCVIHAIRIKSSYELDDTFAKEVGQCETLAEMREKVRKSMQAYIDERGEMDLQDRLMRQAADSLNFTPSEKQLQAEMDDQMQNLTAQLAQQGLTMEMYCQFMQTTEETLREESRANALNALRTKAAMEQIVDLEGLQANKEEVAQAVAVIARQNGMTIEQLKPYYDTQFELEVVRSVLMAKAMNVVREAAEITVTTDAE